MYNETLVESKLKYNKHLKSKPHGRSRTGNIRSALQIRMVLVPMVGDGNVSRGTRTAQTAIENFTSYN